MREDDEQTQLVRQLKQLRTGYFVGLAGFIALHFASYTGLWLIVPFTIAALFIALYLIFSQIKCPTCGVPLLSRKAIRSPDKCINCGRDLNGKKPSKRAIEDELFERTQDERASTTDWKPMQAATGNFDAHRLHINRKGQLTFKSTLTHYIFAATFLLLGLFAYTIVYIVTSQNGWINLLATSIPLMFVIGGLFLTYEIMTPIRIHQASGQFILGWRRDDRLALNKIAALQLLSVRNSGARYENYQLNLVTHDKERRHVVSYYNRKKAMKAAEQLATHLNVPLWNGLKT